MDETRGSEARERLSGRVDPVRFVFNRARYKPSSDPYWRRGCVAGGCLLFDGYSTFIEAPSLPETSAQTGFTLSAWVAPHAFEWGDGEKYSGLLSQYDDARKAGFVFGIHRHGAWGIRLGLGGRRSMNVKTRSSPVPIDRWTHVAASFDPSAKAVTLYRDGRRIGQSALPGDASYRHADMPLRIGKHSKPMSVAGIFDFNTYHGLLDEVRIAPTPLSAMAIAAMVRDDLAANGGRRPPVRESQVVIPRSVYDGDRHRPQYHLIAHAHWMNEPHAPFHFNGQYHLFYQKNPHGPFWHQIHWGHWTSDDMVHWRELPIALYPERDGLAPDGIWSGSASHDADGNPVLFFTAGNDSAFPKERTGMAMPSDPQDPRLRRWVKYPTPVTVQQPGWGTHGQFRDPFVWKEPGRNRWHQLVASGIPRGSGAALLFSSQDLLQWEYKGPFHHTDIGKYPQVGTIWELPVFLPLGKGRDGRTRHIFMFNAHGGRAQRDVYYWIGTWEPDSSRFTADHDAPRVFDIGKGHFTGPSGFLDPKTGRSIVFSIAQGERTPHAEWDSGWAHNGGLPVSMWIGDDDRLRLAPIEELRGLRDELAIDLRNLSGRQAQGALRRLRGDMLEIDMAVELQGAGRHLGLMVRRTPDRQEQTALYYTPAKRAFTIDRRQSSVDPDVRGKERDVTEVELGEDVLRLRVFLDRSMVEAYINERYSLTSRTFPARDDALGLAFIGAADARVRHLRAWTMRGAYGDVAPVSDEGARINPATAWTSGLPNHDFSSCDLTGWRVVRGTAFSDRVVTDRQKFWDGIFYNPSFAIPGRCHLLGYNSWRGDRATGEMHSQRFVLGGDGQINFLHAGGNDIDRLYIALARGEDGQVLIKATGVDYEEYRRVFWDASQYIGETLYLRVVDDATGRWGHVNLDDIHVPVRRMAGFALRAEANDSERGQ